MITFGGLSCAGFVHYSANNILLRGIFFWGSQCKQKFEVNVIGKRTSFALNHDMIIIIFPLYFLPTLSIRVHE